MIRAQAQTNSVGDNNVWIQLIPKVHTEEGLVGDIKTRAD